MRLYDELKTFTWVGQTAKAMKGYHDDLVMAIAITVWLFDNSTDNSKYDKEMANAMLAAFAINKIPEIDEISTPHARNPFSPIMVDGVQGTNTNIAKNYARFGWLN